ncbi:MAG: hypothetical protein KDK75_22445, partial [Alphaproteobacteria bacterium]|nr:hypothetical protein [Alphaproteobacteria bacterium]
MVFPNFGKTKSSYRGKVLKAALQRLVLVIVMFVLATAHASAAGPSLLFDPETGEALSQDRAGEPWYPASLTKLMTAYVVFQKLR